MSKKIKVTGGRLEEYLSIVDMVEVLLTESLDVLVIVDENDTIDMVKSNEDADVTKFAVVYNGYPHMAVFDCDKISMKKFEKYIHTDIKAVKEALGF